MFDFATTLAKVNALPIEERIRLIDAIWDSIDAETVLTTGANELTDEQRAELDRRLADVEANPDEAVSWEEVKAAARLRLQRPQL